MRCSISLIPIELLELIIGKLDRESLSAMALTCRAFREASQRQFFSIVYMSTSSELLSLHSTFKDNPRLFDFVRFLSLSEMGSSNWLRRSHTMELLLDFFPRFHKLTSFELFLADIQRWNELPIPLQSACLQLFHASPSLERLILPANVWDIPLDLFSHCKDLQTIHFSQCPHDGHCHLESGLQRSPWMGHLHRPKRLTLWLVAEYSSNVVEPTPTHLIGPPMGLDLHTLEFLSVFIEQTAPDLTPLLQAPLKTLILDIESWDASSQPPDLSMLNSLETLKLKGCWPHISWISSTLLSLPISHHSPRAISISILYMQVRRDATDPEEVAPLTVLVNALAHMHHSSQGMLKRIRLRLPGFKGALQQKISWPDSEQVLDLGCDWSSFD